MKKVLYLLGFIFFSMFALKCDDDYHEDISYRYEISVNFEYGVNLSPTEYRNIYVIWIEDNASGFIQNITVCQKLITGGLTGTVLPYWKMIKYPLSSRSEVDALSSATIANSNFSVSAILKDSTLRRFVLYFEIDRAYEPNDWFTDQPALLYSANINLDESSDKFELLPAGWTPNEETQNIIQNTPMGKLQKEMRYITNHKSGTSFGAADSRSATKMVKKITATVRRIAVAETFENGNKY